MSIQTQEEHIGYERKAIKKSDIFQDRYCFVVVVVFQAKCGCKSILPKTENLTVTVVFI